MGETTPTRPHAHTPTQTISPFLLRPLVEAALREDMGSSDVTTDALVPAAAVATAELVAKAPGILAGQAVVSCVFQTLDPDCRCAFSLPDGSRFEAGQKLARIDGKARALLSGERVALNFLQRLCGIATMTARMVERVSPHLAEITDTRKTTPGLRLLEKYAVRVGGGMNHRFGLSDAVLIKENHIAAAGGIAQAIERAREHLSHTMKIEVETKTLEEVRQGLEADAEIIMLDNMSLDEIREAVQLVARHSPIGRQAVLEVSGGVTEANLAEIAATGVDVISMGAITHSVEAIDLAIYLTEINVPQSHETQGDG